MDKGKVVAAAAHYPLPLAPPPSPFIDVTSTAERLPPPFSHTALQVLF